jgi:hypothetical protein
MGEEANDERAQQLFERSNKIEEQFGNLFTSKTFNKINKIHFYYYYYFSYD